MTIPIYLTASEPAFQPTQREYVPPVQVRVPAGSEVLPVNGLGDQLFVPEDRLVRAAWSAAEVLRAAREGDPRFRLVG